MKMNHIRMAISKIRTTTQEKRREQGHQVQAEFQVPSKVKANADP
ncbi:uncharacterized protein METZ01_LOCUS120814, partial [marine metagenome]